MFATDEHRFSRYKRNSVVLNTGGVEVSSSIWVRKLLRLFRLSVKCIIVSQKYELLQHMAKTNSIDAVDNKLGVLV